MLYVYKKKHPHIEANSKSLALFKALKSGGSKVLDKKNVG